MSPSVRPIKQAPTTPGRAPDPTIWTTRHARPRHDRSVRQMSPGCADRWAPIRADRGPGVGRTWGLFSLELASGGLASDPIGWADNHRSIGPRSAVAHPGVERTWRLS